MALCGVELGIPYNNLDAIGVYSSNSRENDIYGGIEKGVCDEIDSSE
jgi:hypothetical protein